MMAILELVGVNALAVAACFLVLWRVGVRIRDVSFVDSWWALGMVVIAWTSFLWTGARSAQAWLLVGLCTVWGVRLGGYLLWRWRRSGPDRRYVTMMGRAESERGWSFAKASLLLVFALQAPLQLLVCLPVQLGQIASPAALGAFGIGGALLAATGIAFESIGDWQLARFKGDPANRDQVMDKGLWRYTRHPNYFGDACTWWGLWLIAADTGWVGVASIPGPLLITFLLTRWSGVPTVEGRLRRRRPGYEAYVTRTSSFIPWPPKAA